MLELIMIGCLVVGAFHFFGPVGIIVIGAPLLMKKK